jgi:hypothetical protein
MLQLTDTQEADLQVVGKTRKGNPASFENTKWSGSDEAVAAVVPDPADHSKALVRAVAPGTMLVTATVDADLTDGVVDVIGVLEVVVGAGTATVVEIVAGAPREEPAGSPGTSGEVITV